MRINGAIATKLLITLLIIVIAIVYLLEKVNINITRQNEDCICDSSYLMPNIRFLLAPEEIKEISVDGKMIYPTDLIKESDSIMVGRNIILIKLIDGKTIIDSICLEIDCLNYDVEINDDYKLKFEPSTYD